MQIHVLKGYERDRYPGSWPWTKESQGGLTAVGSVDIEDGVPATQIANHNGVTWSGLYENTTEMRRDASLDASPT